LILNIFDFIFPFIYLLFCHVTADAVEVDIVAEPLLGHSATELAAMVRRGEVTSVQLVETFIKQIEKVNPKVRTPSDNPGSVAHHSPPFRCSSSCVMVCARASCVVRVVGAS
jgi:hypothetical protein